MIHLANFLVQNWLITPAALALNEARPRNIHNQKWLLALTGTVDAGLRAILDQDGTPQPQDVQFFPDTTSPCDYAINTHGVPRPPGVEGAQYNVQFQVEMWAPFATVGRSLNWDANMAVIGISNWRPSPFLVGFDMFTGNTIDRIFNGLIVTCELGDSDVELHGIGFHITLLGKIVFTQNRIT